MDWGRGSTGTAARNTRANGAMVNRMGSGRNTTGAAAKSTRANGAMVSGTDGGLLTTKTATRAAFSNGGAAGRSIDANPATERGGERRAGATWALRRGDRYKARETIPTPLFGEAHRLAIGVSLSQVQAAATQLGTDLHIALAGGGDLYLANTTLTEIEADNLVV